MDQATIAPVVKTLTVERTVEDAFAIFTEGIGRWWPLETHAMDPVRVRTAVVEPRRGGRVLERWDDGSEHVWGEVLTWEPPSRFAMSWKPNTNASPPTEVEVTFTADGGSTRVRLEHRGWERLGEDAEDARAGYDTGWVGVLERYGRATSA